MSTVDEILATGWYRDRRGRVWAAGDLRVSWFDLSAQETLSVDEMRLLIERDLHRDECPGLRRCGSHPVPVVVNWTREAGYSQFGAHHRGRNHWVSAHVAAMGAARALAANP